MSFYLQYIVSLILYKLSQFKIMHTHTRMHGRDKWKNKYVSLFVHLMKGENDNTLTFPFRGDFLVQIVNLKENKNHAERLVEFNEKTDPKGEYGAQLTGLTGLLSGRQYRGYGYPNFLSHKFLKFDESRNTQYVSDDDTLHVRILNSYSMIK